MFYILLLIHMSILLQHTQMTCERKTVYKQRKKKQQIIFNHKIISEECAYGPWKKMVSDKCLMLYLLLL